MLASGNGHAETVDMLLKRGAKVDLPDIVRKWIHSCTSYMCYIYGLHETVGGAT